MKKWFIQNGSLFQGPFDSEYLKDGLRTGSLDPFVLVTSDPVREAPRALIDVSEIFESDAPQVGSDSLSQTLRLEQQKTNQSQRMSLSPGPSGSVGPGDTQKDQSGDALNDIFGVKASKSGQTSSQKLDIDIGQPKQVDATFRIANNGLSQQDPAPLKDDFEAGPDTMFGRMLEENQRNQQNQTGKDKALSLDLGSTNKDKPEVRGDLSDQQDIDYVPGMHQNTSISRMAGDEKPSDQRSNMSNDKMGRMDGVDGLDGMDKFGSVPDASSKEHSPSILAKEKELAAERARIREKEIELERLREKDRARSVERELELEKERSREREKLRERERELERERERERLKEKDRELERLRQSKAVSSRRRFETRPAQTDVSRNLEGMSGKNAKLMLTLVSQILAGQTNQVDAELKRKLKELLDKDTGSASGGGEFDRELVTKVTLGSELSEVERNYFASQAEKFKVSGLTNTMVQKAASIYSKFADGGKNSSSVSLGLNLADKQKKKMSTSGPAPSNSSPPSTPIATPSNRTAEPRSELKLKADTYIKSRPTFTKNDTRIAQPSALEHPGGRGFSAPRKQRSTSRKYFLVRSGKEYGPFSSAEIVESFMRGHVESNVKIRKYDSSGKVTVSKFVSHYLENNSRPSPRRNSRPPRPGAQYPRPRQFSKTGYGMSASTLSNMLERLVADKVMSIGLIVAVVTLLIFGGVYIAGNQKNVESRQDRYVQQQRKPVVKRRIIRRWVPKSTPTSKVSSVKTTKKTVKKTTSKKRPTKRPTTSVKKASPRSTYKKPSSLVTRPSSSRKAKGFKVPVKSTRPPAYRRPAPAYTMSARTSPVRQGVLARANLPSKNLKTVTLGPLKYSLSSLNRCGMKCSLTMKDDTGRTIVVEFFTAQYKGVFNAKRGTATVTGLVKDFGKSLILQGVR